MNQILARLGQLQVKKTAVTTNNIAQRIATAHSAPSLDRLATVIVLPEPPVNHQIRTLDEVLVNTVVTPNARGTTRAVSDKYGGTEVSVTPIVAFPARSIPTVVTGIHFFYINVDQFSERRTYMERQFAQRNILYERVSAVSAEFDSIETFIPKSWISKKRADGKVSTVSETTKRLQLMKAEIATVVSHLKALYQFYQSGHDVGIICEDDASFEYESMWPYNLDAIIKNAPPKWEVIQLSATTIDPRVWNAVLTSSKRYFPRRADIYSAVAYAITRSHAEKVLKSYRCKLDKPFECKVSGAINRIQSEVCILGTGPNRYLLNPPPFTHSCDYPSQINPVHDDSHRLSKAIISSSYR